MGATNFLGFGAADLVEIALAALLVTLAVAWRPRLAWWASRLATRTGWCMLLVARCRSCYGSCCCPATLFPHPRDLRRIRPPAGGRYAPPFPPGQSRRIPCTGSSRPSSCSRSPPTAPSIRSGQGLVLAIGWTIFGTPWAGVLLSMAAFCALCYWMLRGWTTPGWALAGRRAGGHRVRPAQPVDEHLLGRRRARRGRLPGVRRAAAAARQRAPARCASCWALGLALHLLTRPYESIFLVLARGALVSAGVATPRRSRARWRAPRRSRRWSCCPRSALTLLQNKARSREVGPPCPKCSANISTAFLGLHLPAQARAAPRRSRRSRPWITKCSFASTAPAPIRSPLTCYAWSTACATTASSFLAPLYLALAAVPAACASAAMPGWRSRWRCSPWASISSRLSASLRRRRRLPVRAGAGGRPGAHGHSVSGWPAGAQAARVVVFLCAGAIRLLVRPARCFDDRRYFARRPPVRDLGHHQPRESRAAHRRRTANWTKVPGKLLVFVRYSPQPHFPGRVGLQRGRYRWLAHRMGPRLGAEEDRELCRYYPGRSVWLLEPDNRPPLLEPYQNSIKE